MRCRVMHWTCFQAFYLEVLNEFLQRCLGQDRVHGCKVVADGMYTSCCFSCCWSGWVILQCLEVFEAR